MADLPLYIAIPCLGALISVAILMLSMLIHLSVTAWRERLEKIGLFAFGCALVCISILVLSLAFVGFMDVLNG